MKARAHVLISGRVQGVYFRSYTQEKAENLGLMGWVRNRRDGRVEAVFEGEEEAVKEMIDWCWRGSPSSKVVDVEVNRGEPTGEFSNFSVSYGYRWSLGE